MQTEGLLVTHPAFGRKGAGVDLANRYSAALPCRPETLHCPQADDDKVGGSAALAYNSRPNWLTYERTLAFATSLRELLNHTARAISLTCSRSSG